MALAIDGSTPALATNTVTTTATVTTASFTPPAGSLLLVLWCGDTQLGVNPASPTITDSLGSHLTYTLLDWQSRADSPNRDGQAATWWAVVGSSAAMTVTVTTGTASGARESALRVIVITGQHATPVGAHGKTGSTGAATIAQNFTGTASSSWGFLVDCDWDSLGTQTAGTGCTALSAGSIGTAISYGFVRRTTADGTNGGTTTMNVTLPGTSTNENWCWVEVVPGAATQPPPVVAAFTTAAVTAARAQAGRGQAILIRAPAGPAASTADATIPEVFGLTADATRAATADVTFTETFGLTADATRNATADASVPSVFGLSVDASTSSATNPAPAGFDFTDAAVVAARAAYARPARPTLLRTPPAGTSTTADATIAEAFGLSVTATRAATADATVASVFGLSVDATTGGASPQPAAFDFTDAASTAALWYRSRVVEPVITRPPGVASSSPIGDVTIAETFGLAAAATRATTGDVAIAEAFALSVTATVSTPGTGQVTITEAFGLSSTAVLGAVAVGTIPETFGLTTSATRATAGAALLAETFALTADSTRGASAAATVGSVFGLTVAAIITTGFPADGTAGPGIGTTVHAGPGTGVPAARATGGA